MQYIRNGGEDKKAYGGGKGLRVERKKHGGQEADDRRFGAHRAAGSVIEKNGQEDRENGKEQCRGAIHEAHTEKWFRGMKESAETGSSDRGHTGNGGERVIGKPIQ